MTTQCLGGCVFDSSIINDEGHFTIPTWTPILVVVPNGFNIVTKLYPIPPWKPWPRPVSPWVPPVIVGQEFLPGHPWPPYWGWPGDEIEHEHGPGGGEPNTNFMSATATGQASVAPPAPREPTPRGRRS
jgi:hypothetical protein